MAVEWAFQQAVFTALNGATLGAQGVYDIAPQSDDGSSSAPYPFITMGTIVVDGVQVDEVQSFNAVLRVHTWSRTASMKQTREIQGAVYGVLHNASLSVSGFNCYSILRESTDVMLEKDGVIHGVCEYRALLQAT